MKKYALLGYPLGHSFSPIIHNEIYKLYNIDATYELHPVKEDELKNAIDLLKNGTFSGFNVTIPYKIEVMKYLDEISPEALKIGSVNTVLYKNGKTIGYNTDYYGFIDELKLNKIDVCKKDIYILGTGGASKAIVKAILDLGGNANLVSRNIKENIIDYNMLANIKKIDGIVNTTPVGMYPNSNDSPINEEVAKRAGFIVDIIFNPLKTKLMSYNKNSCNGLQMLIFQASKAISIWNDIEIDNKLVYERLRGDFNE